LFKKILSTWEFTSVKEKNIENLLNLRVLIEKKQEDLRFMANIRDLVTESFNCINEIKPQYDDLLGQHYRNLQIRADDIKEDAKYIEEITYWTMDNFIIMNEKIEKKVRSTIRCGIIIFDFNHLKQKMLSTIEEKKNNILGCIPDYLRDRFDTLRTWFKDSAFLYQMTPTKLDQYIELQYKAKLGNIAMIKGRAILGIYSKLLKITEDHGQSSGGTS